MNDRRRGSYWVPGDPRTYVLPQDIKDLDAAWAAYLGSQAPIDDIPEDSRGEADMSPEAIAERARLKARHDEAVRFIASYEGTFGLILDIRANPKWGTKYLRLSPRQVDAVLRSRDRDLERIETARINTELYADDEYQLFLSRKETPDARPQNGEAPGLEAQRPTRSTSPSAVTDGWYMVGDQPWKVQWNRERTRLYAKRLVLRGPRAELRESGLDVAAVPDWEYVPGGLRIIASEGVPMTTEVAQGYGKLYGVCAVCGRILTDEKSIADGLGPVCAAKL